MIDAMIAMGVLVTAFLGLATLVRTQGTLTQKQIAQAVSHLPGEYQQIAFREADVTSHVTVLNKQAMTTS